MSVLVVIAARTLFKKDPGITLAANIIRCVFITYAILACIYYSLELYRAYFSINKEQVILNRATGPYWFAFWFWIFSNTLLPLLLFFNQLKDKIYFLLILTILMNLGWLFESFVIHITSMHRDYVKSNALFPFRHEINILLRGIAVGILALIAGVLLNKKKFLQKHTE